MAALQPSWRFTLRLAKYPASLGTTVYRWSKQPYADAGAWSEGRILNMAPFERSCSDQDGNYALAKLTITLTDADGLFRGLLSDPTTKVIVGREGTLEVLSEAGRHAGTPWRTVFRGRVSAVTPLAGRQAQIEVTDLVGSQFSGFDLDKTIPAVTIQKSEWPNAPDTSIGKVYPLVFGEYSDMGAVDVTGADAAKGMLPAIYVGDYDVTGSLDPPAYGAPPVITGSGVVGTSGEQTYYYAASLITPFGESGLSNVVAINGAAVRNLSNYNYLIGTYDTAGSINKVRIWRSDSPTFTTWINEASYSPGGTFGYYDGAAPWPTATHDALDLPKPLAPRTTVGALQSTNVWGHYVVALGAIQEILGVYASNLANGTEPKRVLLDPSLDGVEFLTPQSAAWPYPDKWLVRNGIRCTVILLRGPRNDQAQQGAVTVAVNLCGYEETGDTTGLLVDEAFKVFQLFLNEHVLKNGGTGYRDGNWGPLEEYDNGDPQLQTTAFAAAQAISVERVGPPRGYVFGFAVTEPLTLREIAHRLCLTGDCRCATNHHGQTKPVVIDDLADPTAGRLYVDRIDIKTFSITIADNEIEDRITYSFDWDADGGKYRTVNQVLEDAVSIAAHTPGAVAGDNDRRGVHETQPQELFCTRDVATAKDSRARRLTRNKYAPVYVTITVDLSGLEEDLGSQIRITHYDGLGTNGYNKAPFIVLSHRVDPENDEVTLTCLELSRIAADGGLVMTGTGFIMTTTTEMR